MFLQDNPPVAVRTRSKLPLNQTTLVDLESQFVAPDITPDMYPSAHKDDDWLQFLASIHKEPAGQAEYLF